MRIHALFLLFCSVKWFECGYRLPPGAVKPVKHYIPSVFRFDLNSESCRIQSPAIKVRFMPCCLRRHGSAMAMPSRDSAPTYPVRDFVHLPHNPLEGCRLLGLSVILEGYFFTKLPRVRHDCYTDHCTARRRRATIGFSRYFSALFAPLLPRRIVVFDCSRHIKHK